ncbi:hypothetical protein L1887_15344 [Cichorium endivia]|nr:hypothetical protein L1887_15344 [Cichorium endivia]
MPPRGSGNCTYMYLRIMVWTCCGVRPKASQPSRLFLQASHFSNLGFSAKRVWRINSLRDKEGQRNVAPTTKVDAPKRKRKQPKPTPQVTEGQTQKKSKGGSSKSKKNKHAQESKLVELSRQVDEKNKVLLENVKGKIDYEVKKLNDVVKTLTEYVRALNKDHEEGFIKQEAKLQKQLDEALVKIKELEPKAILRDHAATFQLNTKGKGLKPN